MIICSDKSESEHALLLMDKVFITDHVAGKEIGNQMMVATPDPDFQSICKVSYSPDWTRTFIECRNKRIGNECLFAPIRGLSVDFAYKDFKGILPEIKNEQSWNGLLVLSTEKEYCNE